MCLFHHVGAPGGATDSLAGSPAIGTVLCNSQPANGDIA
jgi:hypothetical protein